MKTTRLLSAICLATAVSTAALAQVKLGQNPTTVTAGSDLDVESNVASHVVVMKHGGVGINTSAPQGWLDVRGTTKVLANNSLQTGTIWTGTSNMDGFEVTSTGEDLFVGIQRRHGAPLHLAKPSGLIEESFIIFGVDGLSAVGSIKFDGVAGVIYNTTSDQRLKENIRSTKFGLEALKAVRVYDYNFKADQKKALSTGVLAQELYKVYPQAVTVGGADAKNAPWQVDYSKLVPVLVRSVQELNEKIESLETAKAQLSAELTSKTASLAELNERIGRIERALNSEGNAKSVSR